MGLAKSFAYLITGVVLIGAALKEVVGSFLTAGPLETFFGVNPWVALAIFLIGLGYFLIGLYDFIMTALALAEKRLHKVNALRYHGKK